MDPIPLPSSLAEAEALITAMYQPQSPQNIQRIQEVLQRLQKTPQGWELGQALLANPDAKIRFFGALTLIVKLNTESSVLSEDDAKNLLQTLIGWLIRSIEDGSGLLVIRKLSSALATYFIYFSHLWTRCVRHLVQCLDLGRAFPVDSVDDALHVGAVADKLSLDKLNAAIFFAAAFVEDVAKTDINSAKYADLHKRLVHNGEDALALLAVALRSDPSQGPKKIPVQRESINCLHSWITYEQKLARGDVGLVKLLRPLIDVIIPFVASDELCDPTVQLLTDTLGFYSGFLTETHYRALAAIFESNWFQDKYRSLMEGDFELDTLQFGFLMLAYGDARVPLLMESTDVQVQRFLSGLVGLTGAPGYIVAEDKIFVPALEFWSQFVETMTDTVYSQDEEGRQVWVPMAMEQVMQVVSNCWRKIQWPDIETFLGWDSNDRTGFGEARKDVADLLQSVYTLSGRSLVSRFVGLLLQHLSGSSWAELEASAFCLGSLADRISDDDAYDDMLSQVFAGPYFDLLSQGSAHIPVRLRHTSLQLIERYSDYFERRPEFLPAALNVLFDALGDKAVGGGSAKSISTLCSSCRHLLTSEVPTFLGQFDVLYNQRPIDAIAEEKVVLAIACIIQAVGDETKKLEAFARLFSYARMDIERSLYLASNPQALLPLDDPLYQRGVDSTTTTTDILPGDMSLQLCLRGLRCISAMAKGMQAIVECPIDLEASVTQAPRSEQLVMLQDAILRTLNQALVTFRSNGEVVEVICNILRSGFIESEPGPFVFPPETVSDFFTSMTVDTPRIGTVVSTACSFLSSLYKGPNEQIYPNLSRLLPWVIGLLQASPEDEGDTSLALNAIDFVQRLMVKRPEVLFQLQPGSLTEFFFLYTLNVLGGKEPLPKNAAAEFWTNFLTLNSVDPAVQTAISGAMEHLGPLVSHSLIQNIGGNASRSELDKLSEPLKKLIVQQVGAQAWLEQALFSDDFPSSEVSAEEKSMFLKKILNLRGARQTNQVVREFWLACRGSNFAYVS